MSQNYLNKLVVVNNKLFAVGDGEILSYSKDLGWHFIFGHTFGSGNYQTISYGDNKYIAFSINGTSKLVSIDGGNSWQEIKSTLGDGADALTSIYINKFMVFTPF